MCPRARACVCVRVYVCMRARVRVSVCLYARVCVCLRESKGPGTKRRTLGKPRPESGISSSGRDPTGVGENPGQYSAWGPRADASGSAEGVRHLGSPRTFIWRTKERKGKEGGDWGNERRTVQRSAGSPPPNENLEEGNAALLATQNVSLLEPSAAGLRRAGASRNLSNLGARPPLSFRTNVGPCGPSKDVGPPPTGPLNDLTC